MLEDELFLKYKRYAIDALAMSLNAKEKTYIQGIEQSKRILASYEKERNHTSATVTLKKNATTLEENINPNYTYSQAPTSPNKTIILLISLVLGLMGGVLIVLFKNYWREAK